MKYIETNILHIYLTSIGLKINVPIILTYRLSNGVK